MEGKWSSPEVLPLIEDTPHAAGATANGKDQAQSRSNLFVNPASMKRSPDVLARVIGKRGAIERLLNSKGQNWLRVPDTGGLRTPDGVEDSVRACALRDLANPAAVAVKDVLNCVLNRPILSIEVTSLEVV